MRPVLFAVVPLLLYALPASSQVERWSLVPELRIGSVDDPQQSLTRIADAAVGPDNHLYVVQPQDHAIRVFDSKGVPVRTIGREGQGPGEFSDLIGPIGFLGDTLYVSDPRLQRVSLFDLNGRFLTSMQLSSPALEGKFRPSVPMRMLADGTALVSPSYAARTAAAGETLHRPLLRIDRNGTIINTVVRLPAGKDQISIQKGEMMHFTSQPFTDEPILAVSRSGNMVVVVDRKVASGRTPAHFRVTRLTAAGDTVFSKRYRYTPVPVSKAYVDSVVAGKAESMAKGPMFGNAVEAERELRKVLFLPSMLVPITGAVVGSDGSTWLKREDRPGNVQVWNIIDAQGNVRAMLTAPKTTAIRAIHGNTVWAIERDEWDVPYLVKYSVRRVQP